MISAVPEDAQIELRGDAGEYYQAVGDKVFSNIPIGTYTMRVTLVGYLNHDESILLMVDDKLSRNVKLEPQQNEDFTNREMRQGNPSTGSLTDMDGNVYKTIKIGDQWWMAENLKVTHYRNGDAIQNISANNGWISLSVGAYCEYDNDRKKITTYGRLYNWYAVNDSRDIAPSGWHVPSDAEWQILVEYLGGTSNAGGGIKEIGTKHWSTPNMGATDESGFCALPGGYRYYVDGNYNYMGSNAFFWSATERTRDYAWYRNLTFNSSVVGRSSYYKRYGFSVRLVKD